MTEKRTGSCLCGGVSYEINGLLREIIGCHCRQCRKTSGHHVAATEASLADFHLTSEETLSWYPSSDEASRGFCRCCGGNLFWKRKNKGAISIMAGTLDQTAGLDFSRHIHAADKADYVSLPDAYATVSERD